MALQEMIKEGRGFGVTSERFWTKQSIGIYRLGPEGDLNRCVGNRVKGHIPGAFGVPGKNLNGGRVTGICDKRRLLRGNACFKHKCIYNYTRVVKGQDRTEVESMMALGEIYLRFKNRTM